MKKTFLTIIAIALVLTSFAQKKILFENTKSEMAGNADWFIDDNQSISSRTKTGITQSTAKDYRQGQAVSSSNEQLLSEDFSTCPAANWTSYSVSSNTDWTCNNQAMSVNGYNGDAASDDWLISPAMDFSGYSSISLNFDSWTRYTDNGITDPELKVKYSADYPGSGNPEGYTWTEISYSFPAENSQTWTKSGDIDLSAISGTAVYIAFQYTSSGMGAGTTTLWQVDNVNITGQTVNNDSIKPPFSKGVGFSVAFESASVYDINFNYYTRQDFINVKKLGIDEVRLPIYMSNMLDDEGKFDSLFLYLLDQYINIAEEEEVNILITNMQGYDYSDPNLENEFINIWTQMALHLKNRSKFVYYELANEPSCEYDEDWGKMQGNILDAVRKIDTVHTILVTSNSWSNGTRLRYLPEYNDDNLIYVFHFYDPFLFTHQGADFVGLSDLKGVPFPYDADRMPDLPASFVGTDNEYAYNNYSNDGTVEAVQELISYVVNFKNKRNVPVVCDEFGADQAYSDPEDRAFWYKTLRTTLEENNIAWSMHGYTHFWGPFEYNTCNLFDYDLDSSIVSALGLTLPTQSIFTIEPDTTGFTIYDDYVNRYINFYITDEIEESHPYCEDDPENGKFCIQMKDFPLWDCINFDFQPDKDLSLLKDKGYAIDFWIKGNTPEAKFNLCFVDTDTGNDDHPWKMAYEINESLASWDGEWHHVQIPLSSFAEQGITDNGVWYDPAGLFDWSAIDHFRIATDFESFKGITFWFDDIKISKVENEEEILSIAEVQGNTDESPYNGQVVTVQGEVVSTTQYGCYIQDANAIRSGIWVYNASFSQFELGSGLKVKGTVNEYNGLTQIKDIESHETFSSTIGISPFNLPQAAINEDYESMLVYAENVETVNDNGNNDWYVKFENEAQFLVDNKYCALDFSSGQNYNLTGIIEYNYNEFRLSPRSSADIKFIAPTTYSINGNANPANGGTVTGSGTYNQGSQVTLTATPNDGYEFINWTENGNVVSTAANYQFTVTNYRDLVANFKLTQTHVDRTQAFEAAKNLGKGIVSQENFVYGWDQNPDLTIFRDIAGKGFKHIRMAINYTEIGGTDASSYPYTMKADFLEDVTQAIDSAIAAGLKVVLCGPADELFMYEPDNHIDILYAFWEQMASHFQNRSTDDLLFEISNEPHFNMTAQKWNELFPVALAKIRESNPDRMVIIEPANYSFIDAATEIILPDDPNLILGFHCYSPGTVIGEGNPVGNIWTNDYYEFQNIYSFIETYKELADSLNIPLWYGEGGALKDNPDDTRSNWAQTISNICKENNIGMAYFDYASNNDAGTGMKNRDFNSWNDQLVNAYFAEEKPTVLNNNTLLWEQVFDADLGDCSVYSNKPEGEVTYGIKEGELYVTSSTSTSNMDDIQLTIPPYTFEKGHYYAFSFTSRTSKGIEPFSLNFSGLGAVSAFTPGEREFCRVFYMNDETVLSYIYIPLGTVEDTVFFKNVAIHEITPVLAESISINVPNTEVSYANEAIQLTVNVLPENTSEKSAKWSVTAGEDNAIISREGLLVVRDSGWVTVRAVTQDGTGLTAEKTFFVSIENSTLSIAEVQGNTDESPYNGQVVTVQGEVVSTTQYGCYIQDANAIRSGIWVYNASFSQFELGSGLKVKGTVNEYNGLTQIKDIESHETFSSTIGISPFNLPQAAINEDYESMLVYAENVETVNDNGNNDWYVKFENEAQFLVDNKYCALDFSSGQNYNLTGIIEYNYNEFRLSPRSSADIEFIAPTTYSISVNANPADGGTVTGSGTYIQGTQVTLTATPNDGYEFINWTKDGDEISTSTEYSFTASTDISLTANFNKITGVTNTINPNAIQIFPNPANHIINIIGLPITENLRISVCNNLGQELIVVRSNSQSTIQVELNTLPNGIYFLRINGNGTDKTLKVIYSNSK
ncbi:MAG: cellulase family glycosylhydrolase [Bacteroidales bacterium]